MVLYLYVSDMDMIIFSTFRWIVAASPVFGFLQVVSARCRELFTTVLGYGTFSHVASLLVKGFCAS